MIRNFLNVLFKPLTESKMSKTEKLHRLVDAVQTFFKNNNADVPFYIAGGSVYSTLHGNSHYNDIDVFFYSLHDFNIAANSVKSYSVFDTNNALSLSVPNVPTGSLQLIKLHTGPVEEVFKTFDFNCSRCAITSDKEIIVADVNNVNIKIDTNNINGMVISRYSKYTKDKHAIDENHETLKSIIKYLSKNHTKIFNTNYYKLPDVSGTELLSQAISECRNHGLMQFMHDTIADNDEQTRIDIFKYLTSLITYHMPERCDEYILCEIMYQRKQDRLLNFKGRKYDDEEKRVMLKYAEYFI